MGLWNWFKGIVSNMVSPLPPDVEADMEGVKDVSESGLELIGKSEDYRQFVYLDQGGRPTIGFGHLLLPGEAEKFAGGLTREQAKELRRQDAAKAVRAINSLKIHLNQNQFDALVSFTFNVGIAWTQKSGLRDLLLSGRYDLVPAKLKEYNKVTNKKTGKRTVSKGLVARRAVEALLFAKVD